MDFYRINQRRGKNGVVEVYPDFRVCRSKDLMVRAKDFYAIWDEEKGLWSTDEYDVQRLVDADLDRYAEWLKAKSDDPVRIMALGSFDSGSWLKFQSYLRNMSDNAHDLDRTVTFANTKVSKEDYISKRLPYKISERGALPTAYNELIGTLYEPVEREKLEWAVGSVISGDSTWIQKFIVLYGSAGAGKSTFLNIVQMLFAGYYTTFEAKALVGNSNQFATEAFSSNPLVAIQHDGDLSRIEDNTKLNSLVSHEIMRINEKNKPTYDMVSRAFMFMGTNKPVRITDAKSGIIRRLIDVRPSGSRVSPVRYQTLMTQIHFELGEIARHCLDIYQERGSDFYSGYVPVEMMLQTDVFYNFIESNVLLFTKQDGTTLAQAYELYKEYCDEALVEYKLPRHKFREELKNYFREFHDRFRTAEGHVRSWYSGFKTESFDSVSGTPEEGPLSLVFRDSNPSTNILNILAANCPAQPAVAGDRPGYKWENVTLTLSDIDTTKTHFVRLLNEQHIVIDFDLKDEFGNKSLEMNLKAASKWPATYAELSKGGNGIHLHYIYDGDVDLLAPLYGEGIEIKVFRGLSSLRRRLSQSNNIEVAHLSGGLPQREKRMIDKEAVKDEKHLRALVEKALRKEIQPNTKPAIDFIAHILLQAYDGNLEYDLTDLRTSVLAFASGSSNNGLYCIKVVNGMKFKSKAAEASELNEKQVVSEGDGKLVIFDVEVYPNLFLISWKYFREEGVYSMINPSIKDISWLLTQKLIGFYNRDYDNHILYAAHLGYNNAQLFDLSQRLVSGDRNAKFGSAYNLSYLDIYEMASKKMSLKRWEIELGIPHLEMAIPWDQPVPKEMWPDVSVYCENDVLATERVLEERWQDYVAREILASLSGLRMNAKTQEHTARIIFGENRRPQNEFVYTKLDREFPGYEWEITTAGVVSHYRGEVVGEGGYVYAEPGMYTDVALLDVASMHPASLININHFGPYTKNFDAIRQARLAIKHGDYESAGRMFGGKLKSHLGSQADAEALSYALKIAINIVYGMTSAKFDNIFRHPSNKDNIVAKRGALFMIDLKNYVQELGYTVAHIKTDSIKIPNATPDIIDAVMEFGMNYGYEFEHEATYKKMCLVNDAVYVAEVAAGKKPEHWTATGAQFIEPYVFKTLFSKEELEFKDLVQIKGVQTALYLDFTIEEPEFTQTDEPFLPTFVGKVGGFVPVKPGTGGGVLLRVDKTNPDKYHAATGSSGFLWKDYQVVEKTHKEDQIDMRFYDRLVEKAKENMSRFGDVEMFLSQ